MHAPAPRLAATAAALLLTAALAAGCSTATPHTTPHPDPVHHTAAPAGAYPAQTLPAGPQRTGVPGRQDSATDAVLTLHRGPCRYHPATYHASQTVTITGTVTHPVVADVVFYVQGKDATIVATGTDSTRLQQPGPVHTRLTVTAQMSAADWAKAVDGCATTLGWVAIPAS